jgi:hypothetical protein
MLSALLGVDNKWFTPLIMQLLSQENKPYKTGA